ncbi:Glyoxylate/hydroxypyruvate reductase A [Roseivivax sp. THAF40]|uniref:2-hydroxyacid dehydrogenase n=1 Tax=unclassified Roseivivax TaxID=2639302 RepID=UPI001268FA9B|nr:MULTISPECIES: glyoxylate/hydroxypyruvate reductase A [unclassified Roseivivax]QFS81499.1 Glyoxylate/hydroxypyruvate reductase A [Roseivivax sp. THAF197b]QFT45228.1 Glyoxylate/hydroxypyruvate reductase A [Roseivivax sp. THAF40]
MSVNVLFAAREAAWASYEAPLRKALKDAGVAATLSTDLPAEEVDYIIYAPNSTLQDFTPFTRTKAILNLWAGVEGIVKNPTLTQPLARMVDEDGLTQGMVEWVTGHVLRHHLGMDAHIVNPDHDWIEQAPPLARERVVTILGLGTLGTACAEMLVHLGFELRGWSRSGKRLDGVTCYSGQDGLEAALSGADIVVLLLPDTPATENVMSAHSLSLIKRGGVIINPGRGPLIDDAALLSALDTGQIGHATLDVFRTEPLPQDDPYWTHPRVTVTPHIASETRTDSAARVIAENIRRGEAGEPLLHLVDRKAGY